jgi:lactoylglutathione lyase
MTTAKSLFDVAMELQATDVPNVRQAVPFFNVKDIEASLRFHVEGLGFTITRHWDPDGRIRWCWLAIAVYHDSRARGLEPSRPYVGNNLWVTSLIDPDGYRVDFESPTDVPEETVYSDPA